MSTITNSNWSKTFTYDLEGSVELSGSAGKTVRKLKPCLLLFDARIIKYVKRSNTYHKTHPFCHPRQSCGNGEHVQYDFLQVDRCLNEPFSTYCIYCIFYKLILRTLLIIILGYCVFYKLTSAYIVCIALRLLHNIVLHCIAYFTTSHLDVIIDLLLNRGTATWSLFVKPRAVAKKFVGWLSWKMSQLKKAQSGLVIGILGYWEVWGVSPKKFLKF